MNDIKMTKLSNEPGNSGCITNPITSAKGQSIDIQSRVNVSFCNSTTFARYDSDLVPRLQQSRDQPFSANVQSGGSKWFVTEGNKCDFHQLAPVR